MHHGGAKNVIPPQHRLHSASGAPTISPQARQRGGNTPSTMARPIRSNLTEVLLAKVADACIRTHDQAAGAFVNRLRGFADWSRERFVMSFRDDGTEWIWGAIADISDFLSDRRQEPVSYRHHGHEA